MKTRKGNRGGSTEKEARTAAIMVMQAWEKEYRNNGNDVNFKKSKLFGEYMTEYLENKVKGTFKRILFQNFSK